MSSVSREQVDVLAINWRTKDILLGECKWGDRAVGNAVIRALLHKADKVLPGNFTWHTHHIFFARHSFAPAAQALAQEHNARLVALGEMEPDMQRWLQMRAAQ